MNKLIAVGNLGHSASVRSVDTARGAQPVVNFSLAVKIGYGEQERTQWYDCHWWGDRAERVSQWLSRGRRVVVEGEPELELYTKKDGSTGAKVRVRVLGVEFAGDAVEREGAGASRPVATGAGAPGGAVAGGVSAAKVDEDVPY